MRNKKCNIKQIERFIMMMIFILLEPKANKMKEIKFKLKKMIGKILQNCKINKINLLQKNYIKVVLLINKKLSRTGKLYNYKITYIVK